MSSITSPSTTPSAETPDSELIKWRQHRIHGQRMTERGLMFDVEMRGNGKRMSQWIPFSEVSVPLMRLFEAKRRLERSHTKEVMDANTEKNSQTLFILSDAEDDDNEVVVISSDSEIGDSQSFSSLTLGPEMQTPRRSGRTHRANKLLLDFVSQHKRPYHRRHDNQIGDNGHERADQLPQTPVHFQSTPLLPEDDSYHFLSFLSEQTDSASQIDESERRRSRSPTRATKKKLFTRSSPAIQSLSLLEAIPAVRQKRKYVKRVTDMTPTRRSIRVMETTAAAILKDAEDELTSSLTTSKNETKVRKHSGRRSKTQKEAGGAVVHEGKKKGRQSCVKNKTQDQKSENSEARKRINVIRSLDQSETCLTRATSQTPASDITDELSTITDTREESHISPSVREPTVDVPQSQDSPLFAKPSIPCRARQLNTTMTQKKVKTSTTKFGRKSVTTIEDSSFLYDVNAIEREDADIQRKTKEDEARIRRKSCKLPEISMKQFYQTKVQSLNASMPSQSSDVSHRKASGNNRRLSLTTQPLWPSSGMDASLRRYRSIGSVPVEIKGHRGDHCVVEFSIGPALCVPAHMLESNFPDQHKHLMAQCAARIRPSTSALPVSNPSLRHSLFNSLSSPRTPVHVAMSEGEPESESDLLSPFDRTTRRASISSLISEEAGIDGNDEAIGEIASAGDRLSAVENETPVVYESTHALPENRAQIGDTGDEAIRPEMEIAWGKGKEWLAEAGDSQLEAVFLPDGTVDKAKSEEPELEVNGTTEELHKQTQSSMKDSDALWSAIEEHLVDEDPFCDLDDIILIEDAEILQ